MGWVVNLRDYPLHYRHRVLPPDGSVIRIDRITRYGNPYRIGDPEPSWTPQDGPWGAQMGRDDVLRLFAEYTKPIHPSFWEPLRGKQMACWCRPKEGFQGRLLCHGQIIAGILYGVEPETVE